jgi:hypothetical protein
MKIRSRQAVKILSIYISQAQSEIICNDIAKVHVEAIVNAVNEACSTVSV